MQLLQTGTNKTLFKNRIPGITHIFNSINDKTCLIRNYAVKVRQRELRAGDNNLSAARGLRRII
jgi:hypothetical protein